MYFIRIQSFVFSNLYEHPTCAEIELFISVILFCGCMELQAVLKAAERQI